MRVIELSSYLLLIFLISRSGHYVSAEIKSHKIVCFYSARGIPALPEQNKFGPEDLKPALKNCTHLVYNFAQIAPDFGIESTDPKIDTEVGNNLYRKITSLKRSYPHVKFLITLGGVSNLKGQIRYYTVLDNVTRMEYLVNTTLGFMKKYGFDGVNMGFNFHEIPYRNPEVPEIEGVTIFERIRDSYTRLVKKMHDKLKEENFITAVTILPFVNYTVYYDPENLNKHTDLLILTAYDFPNPSSAYDLFDPEHMIYYKASGHLTTNIQNKIRYFKQNGFDSKKMILSIPSFGSLNIVSRDDVSSTQGNYSNMFLPRSVPFYETCAQVNRVLNNERNSVFIKELRRTMPEMIFEGSDDDGPMFGRWTSLEETKPFILKDKYAIWLTYEDVDGFGYKTRLARSLGLGGVSIPDMRNEDYKGACGEKFPLVRAMSTNWVDMRRRR